MLRLRCLLKHNHNGTPGSRAIRKQESTTTLGRNTFFFIWTENSHLESFLYRIGMYSKLMINDRFWQQNRITLRQSLCPYRALSINEIVPSLPFLLKCFTIVLYKMGRATAITRSSITAGNTFCSVWRRVSVMKIYLRRYTKGWQKGRT